MPRIRAARLAELETLREIERDAGRAFAELGMSEIADDDPLPIAELERFAADGRAWVAIDGDDVPVGYLLSEVVDGCAHVAQVSVARSFGRRGLGAALIDHLGAVTTQEQRRWVTLTTFRDVPWNAPYYRRLGFARIEPGDTGPELAALMEREAASLPGEHARVAMRRATSR